MGLTHFPKTENKPKISIPWAQLVLVINVSGSNVADTHTHTHMEQVKNHVDSYQIG